MFCFIVRSRFPLPFESVKRSFFVVSTRLWTPKMPRRFSAARMAATMTMRMPLSVAALVFFSMATNSSSGPLPALERAEGDEETEDGDGQEVDDRPRVDETAREPFEARREADERDDVAQPVVEVLDEPPARDEEHEE